MAHIEIQSTPTSAVGKSVLPRRFVARFIVSSVTSMAGLISIVLTGPVTCRVAAIDPALEAFYLAHVVGWFWSLARMWSLTLEARNRHQTTSIPKTKPKERRCHRATQPGKNVRLQDPELARSSCQFHRSIRSNVPRTRRRDCHAMDSDRKRRSAFAESASESGQTSRPAVGVDSRQTRRIH